MLGEITRDERSWPRPRATRTFIADKHIWIPSGFSCSEDRRSHKALDDGPAEDVVHLARINDLAGGSVLISAIPVEDNGLLSDSLSWSMT